MAMSKAVESRMWPFEHPLAQSGLSQNLLYNLQRWADDLSVFELKSKSAAELGALVHLNEAQGAALLRAAKEFPAANITYALRPLNSELLKLMIRVDRSFTWSNKAHGSMEPFWIWVESHDGIDMLQGTNLSFRPGTHTLTAEFIVPIHDFAKPPFLTIRFVSDKWLGAEEEITVALDDLVMPTSQVVHTPSLDLPFLGFRALRNTALEASYLSRYTSLNGLQTQCFFTLYNTWTNALVSAPTAGGKGILAQLVIWCVAGAQPKSNASNLLFRRSVLSSSTSRLALYITRRKTHAHSFAMSLRFLRGIDAEVQVCVASDELGKPSSRPTVRVTTASTLLSLLSRSRAQTLVKSLNLVVYDDIESMNDTYELAISLLLHATQTFPVRFIGLTASLTDPSDVADWLRSPLDTTFAFLPSDREQAIITGTHTFTTPYSLALFKAMAHPVYTAVKTLPPTESTLIFVPSRSVCRSVATQLITHCAVEAQTRGFLRPEVDQEQMEVVGQQLRDPMLADCIQQGIGIVHDGTHPADRRILMGMFADGILPVLIVPRELCWMPLRAGLVVVMGTQYLHFGKDGGGEDRQIMNYGIHEIIRMQSLAIRHGQMGRFLLLCQAEDRDTFTRFLDQGLPLESELMESEVLRRWVREQKEHGAITSREDVLDILSFTYLARRLESNPTYYDAKPHRREEALSRLVDSIWPSSAPALSQETGGAVGRSVRGTNS